MRIQELGRTLIHHQHFLPQKVHLISMKKVPRVTLKVILLTAARMMAMQQHFLLCMLHIKGNIQTRNRQLTNAIFNHRCDIPRCQQTSQKLPLNHDRKQGIHTMSFGIQYLNTSQIILYIRLPRGAKQIFFKRIQCCLYMNIKQDFRRTLLRQPQHAFHLFHTLQSNTNIILRQPLMHGLLLQHLLYKCIFFMCCMQCQHGTRSMCLCSQIKLMLKLFLFQMILKAKYAIAGNHTQYQHQQWKSVITEHRSHKTSYL